MIAVDVGLFQQMMKRFVGRVIDEGHVRTQVEVDPLRSARAVPQLPDHVEQIGADDGTIQE